MTNKPSIKTVELLQIAAGLAAALRWAISFMPLDGVEFTLSSKPEFEIASFVLSLAFAAVEVGSAAYMMRAWRKEADKATHQTLALLWVSSLALTVFAQVPPILANINRSNVNVYPFWFQAVWVTASVAVTFVTISGLGYAEKTLEAQAAPQPSASAETDTKAATESSNGSQMALDGSRTALDGAEMAKRTETHVMAQSGSVALPDAILPEPTGNWSVDIPAYLRVKHEASQAEIAAWRGVKRQAVAPHVKKLVKDGIVSSNGRVKLVE